MNTKVGDTLKLMLIGGGEIGKGSTSYETKEIDCEIVKMSGKDHPTFLFIGLASSFADSYYDTIKKIYQNLGCHTVYLKKNNIIHNPDLVKEKFFNADIIYIGGGDTIKLMNSFIEYHLDSLLKDAIKRDCVVVGISAGAILLAKEGFSDSFILRGESNDYSFIDGLSIVDLSICPHYHSDSKKDIQLKEIIKKHKKHVYGLENGVALRIIDKKIDVITSIPNSYGFSLSYDKDFNENKI